MELQELKLYTVMETRREENFEKEGVINSVKQAKENNGHCKGMDWPVRGYK